MNSHSLRCRHSLAVILFFASVGGSIAQTTWRRTYGGVDSNIGSSVRETADGGFIIAGSSGSFGNGGQAYVLKVDVEGIPQWTRNLGDVGVQTGMACREVDGGYVLAGSTTTGNYGGYDMYLVRLDLSGEVLWQRSYGTDAWDLCNDVEVTSDGFLLAGVTYSTGDGDIYVVRTNFEGDTLWTRTLGGSGMDEALGAFVSTDDGAILTGSLTAETSASSADAFVAKVSSEGVTSWMTTFGGDSADYFYSAVETDDGGFACSGGTKSYSNVKQILLAKVNAEGGVVWQEEIGTMGNSEGREIQVTQSGGFAIASYNSYGNAGGKDMVLFLATQDGDFILGKNYGGLADEDGFSVQNTADGGYITLGTAEGYGPGIRSIYVVKGDISGETDDDTVYEMFDDTAINGPATSMISGSTLFPNPANATARLYSTKDLTSAHLFDPEGRMVRTWSTPVPQDLDLRGLADGAYQLVTFTRGNARASQTLIIAGN